MKAYNFIEVLKIKNIVVNWLINTSFLEDYNKINEGTKPK